MKCKKSLEGYLIESCAVEVECLAGNYVTATRVFWQPPRHIQHHPWEEKIPESLK